MEAIFSHLNPQQQKAVSIIKGPVLIVAGPGSGKTKVLTLRIAHLINQARLRRQGVKPENILAIAFTNKASEEIKYRITCLLGEKLAQHSLPTIGTFHAVCSRLLREQGKNTSYGSNFVIYDEKDSLTLIKRVMEGLEISEEQFNPATIMKTISRLKNELIDAKTYQNTADFYPQVVAKVYQAYQKKLKKIKALDFDDLIMQTIELFTKHPKILKKYQKKFKYILVDEYQDTNYAQYILIKLLAKTHHNLFVIGDADQSIYTWRGADFRNILNFENDYPEAQVVFLEKNYRSTQKILDAAYYIISKNKQRQDKKLIAQKNSGLPLTIFEAANAKEEGEFIATNISNLIQKSNLNFSSFVVLYRTNAQSRVLEEVFLENELPYKIVGSLKFYDRKEIKDLLAYLKFLQHRDDLISLERITKLPRKARAFGNFDKIMTDLRNLTKTIPPSQVVKQVLKETGYQNYILNGTLEGENRWENIQELLGVLQKYDNLEPSSALKSFLENSALMQSHDEVETKKNLVNLMTLHCVKGLEFPIVFIVGLEEGLLPHSRSLIEPAQMEEERRLCYVGITRAKERVFLTYARQRELYGTISANPISRFIENLPENLVEKQISNFQ